MFPEINFKQPHIKYMVIQLNRDIKAWLDRPVEDLTRAEYKRGFKFNFGAEFEGIARLGFTTPVIAGIIERIDYIVRDYFIEIVNGDRILTLHFSDHR